MPLAAARARNPSPSPAAHGWGLSLVVAAFVFFPLTPGAHGSHGPTDPTGPPWVIPGYHPQVPIGRPMGSVGPPVVSHGLPWGSNGSHGAPKGLMHWCIWVPMGLHGLYLDICVMFGDRSMSEYVKAENDESTLAGNKISFNQGGLFGAHGPPRSS